MQILNVAWAIALVVLYALALTAIGLTILRGLRVVGPNVDPIPAGTVLGSSFALGSGLFGSVWLLTATAGRLQAPVVATGVLIGLIAAFVSRRMLRKQSAAGWAALAAGWRHGSIGYRLVHGLTVALIVVFALICPAVPGTDAIAFYMAFAKVTAATGAIAPLPRYETFTEIWMLAELNNAALMVLGGELPMRLFAWVSSFGLAVTLWGLARGVGLDLRAAWIAVAALFTSTAMTNVLWDGKTDLMAAPIGLAAVAWALRFGSGPTGPTAVVVGLLSGLAVAAKISYLPVLGVAVAVVAGWRLVGAARRSAGAGQGIGRLALAFSIITFVAALAVVPQIVKNAALFGEPLAPFLYLHRGAGSLLDQASFSPATTRWIIATYPLVLVYGHYWGQHGTLSPIPLAFAPLAVIWVRANRKTIDGRLLLVTVAGILAVVAWLVLRPSIVAPRYYLAPLLLLFLLPSAAAAAGALSASRVLRFVVAASVPVVLALSIAAHVPAIVPAVRYAWRGPASVNVPFWSMLTEINRRAEMGDRVFLAMWYRYALRPDLIQCVDSAAEARTVEAVRSPEALWSALHELGMRFVVFDRLTHRMLLGVEPDPASPPPWLRVHVLHQDQRFAAYELEADATAPPPRAACSPRPNSNGWMVASRAG